MSAMDIRATLAALQARPQDPLCTDAAAAIEKLLAVADAGRDAYGVFEEWHGGASTFEAVKDSLWRLCRALIRAGLVRYPPRGNLDWRGSILDELWQAGFFRGKDRLFHLDPRRRLHGDAEGPTLQDVAAFWLAAQRAPIADGA